MLAEHWTVMRMRDVFQHRKQRGDNQDPLLSVTRDNGVVLQSEVGRRNISSADKGSYWRVYPNDLAYNTMRMWQGVSGCSSYFGIVSPAYTVLKPNIGHESRFLSHLLKHPGLIKQFRSYSQGLTSDVWNLKYSAFARIMAKAPPFAEQCRIAEILDTLDETIRKTEQVMAKLQQTKHGLLHDLLTRGIDDNGELRDPEQSPDQFKDSHFGRIPRDWDVVDLEACLFCPPQNGLYKPASAIGRGALIVGQTAFTASRSIDYSLARRAAATIGEIANWGLLKGDVLISRVFANVEGIGQPILVSAPPEPAVYESNMMRLKINAEVIIGELLCHWLRHPAVRRHLIANANSSNQTSINQHGLGQVPIPLPNRAEQKAIVEAVNAIEYRYFSEQESLAKLRTLKHGLMNDLLTGHVRVNLDERQ